MTTLTTSTEIANLALALIGSDIQISDIAADDKKEDKVCNLFYNPTRDELLEMYPWRIAVAHRPLVLTAGYYEYEDVYNTDPIDITGISKASEAVVTAASHGFVTGDFVDIYDVSGMTEVNRDLPYRIERVDDNSFKLTGINSTNWTTYTSGGKCRKLQPKSVYQDGYTYDLPSDFQQALMIEGETIEGLGDFEIIGSTAGTKYLLTTTQDAVLTYLTNAATTVANFKNSFIEMLYVKLAMNICIPIMGAGESSLEVYNRIAGRLRIVTRQAKLTAAKSLKITKETDTGWLKRSGINAKSYPATTKVVRLR